MPDIQLRFHQDVLVLSAPPARALQRIGIADGRDQQLALLLEPETVEDAYQLEVAAGPQALCALTQALSPIQLTKAGMEGEGEALANRALFRSVYIDYGVAVWADGEIDIAPQYLYANAVPAENAAGA